jgi:hypothetical protein
MSGSIHVTPPDRRRTMQRDGYVRPRAKVFAASQPFEPVMWSIGIVLSGAIISLAWLS